MLSYKPWTLSDLRQATRSIKGSAPLEGRKIAVTGVVYAEASGSVFLDLRPNAKLLIGTDNGGADFNGCVQLAVSKSVYERIKGVRTLEIRGSVHLIGPITEPAPGYVTFDPYGLWQGRKFYLFCGTFFPRAYPYIAVDQIQAAETP